MALIPGGYIILSRKLIESEIWDKPPLYLKVWIYLLSRAQHKPYKKLQRGELRTSIPEIMEACSWYVGYRKETPSKDQIYQVIDWLRKACEGVHESNDNPPMITTTRATHGLVINIEKYDLYQSPKNYESNTEGNNEKDTNITREQRQSDYINKNVKNDKNEQEVIMIISDDENKFINTLNQIEGYPLNKKIDVEMYKTLGERYPELDLLDAVKDYRQFKLDKPLKPNSNPRSQINTHFKNCVNWNKCLKEIKEKPKNNWRGSDKRL